MSGQHRGPSFQRVPQLESTSDAQFTIKFDSFSTVIFTCFSQCFPCSYGVVDDANPSGHHGLSNTPGLGGT